MTPLFSTQTIRPRQRTPRTTSTATNYTNDLSTVGDDALGIPLMRLALSCRLPPFVRTWLSEYRVLFRFFAKKTEPKKCPGLKRRPRRCPASAVQPSSRRSATFCRFVTVTKEGHAMVDYLSPAPTQSDIGGVTPRLSCSRFVWFYPTIVGTGVTVCKANDTVRKRTIRTVSTAGHS